MNCNVAIVSMHDYLDGELIREDVAKLKTHLIACPECRARFEQLERTEALIHTTLETRGVMEASESAVLTQRIMSGLPVRRRKAMGWTQWLRNHPAITVAAVFAIVMLSSFITMWEQDDQLTVRGNDLTQLVIDGDTVTVPEGVHVKGDLTVENGKANVLGDVEGNVTVIEGSLYQASTAHISGQVTTIDQALDWFWYKVTHSFSSLAY
ncbi:zf-HC2 domain-containing protein [Paenibacillus oenotherae]|uniref:Anti-sigma-W factor RsiW n=1 Tax=Paenibacillus oenotherae TaxID=1435645 RepID=A0ABS7D8L3_9BACL|nr:zf-HC2 domain-containing protein [Paenibacillus oenotherae]MBW7476279.1 zf-HC2 domain-containing protein [Paenibacillus oenotherae]